MITQKRLMELLNYNPDNGKFINLTDRTANNSLAGQEAGLIEFADYVKSETRRLIEMSKEGGQS